MKKGDKFNHNNEEWTVLEVIKQERSITNLLKCKSDKGIGYIDEAALQPIF